MWRTITNAKSVRPGSELPVLLTIEWNQPGRSTYRETTMGFYDSTGKFVNSFFLPIETKESSATVVAWMPLPDPYGGSGSTTEPETTRKSAAVKTPAEAKQALSLDILSEKLGAMFDKMLSEPDPLPTEAEGGEI